MWWPQTAKQEGGRIKKTFPCNVMWTNCNERPNVGVSTKNRDGAPSRNGCVVNGRMA